MSDPDTATHPSVVKRPRSEPSSPAASSSTRDSQRDQPPRRRPRIEPPVTETVVDHSPSVAPPQESNALRATHTDTFRFGHVLWADLTPQQTEIVDAHWHKYFLEEWSEELEGATQEDPRKIIVGIGLARGWRRARTCMAEYPQAREAVEKFQEDYEELEYYYNMCTHAAWTATSRSSSPEPPPPPPPPIPASGSIPGSPTRKPGEISSDFKHTPRKLTPDELKNTVNRGVNEYHEFFADISKGWKPSEQFGPDRIICLLLQDLGADDTLTEQADTVFNDDFNAIYINSPGSGKSKTILHALTKKWGFYFSFSDASRANLVGDQLHGYGSLDLSLLTEMMPKHSNWDVATTEVQLEANRKIVRRCVGILMVVRVAVLLRFLEAAPSDWSADDCRREWLVIEAAPGLANRVGQNTDIFHTCVTGLRAFESPTHSVDDVDCEGLVKTLWAEVIKEHWHRLQPPGCTDRPKIWAVFDEAQHGVDLHTDYHRSRTDNNAKRSTLSELIYTILTRYDFVDRTVISGTGLSMRDAEEALSSSSARIGSMVTRSRAGAWKDGDHHRKWFLGHVALPEYDWMLKPDDNPVHARLITRSLTWLRGRPRLTAAWAELLLRKLHSGTSPTALHAFFDMYVYSMTGGWKPNDGADLVADEAAAAALSLDEDTAALGMMRGLVNWPKFDEAAKTRKTLRRAVIMAAMRFAFLSLPSNINPEDVEIIESGVAFIKRNILKNAKSIGPITIDEPLSLASIIMKFSDEPVEWINDLSYGALNGVEMGYRLEVEFSLLMLHHFGGHYARLGDVFDAGDSEDWKKLEDRKVTLVGVVERGGVYRSYSSQWTKAPALPFGYRAGTAKQLAEALERGHGFTFFFPDNNCRPDCFAIVRDEKTKKCAILCVQAKFSKGIFQVKTGKYVIKGDTFNDAVDSVEPSQFYQRTNKDGETVTVTEPAMLRIYSALEKMLDAECGDVNDVPVLESKNDKKQSVPEPDEPEPGSKGKGPAPSDDFPRWLRVLTIGPVEADQRFKRAAQKKHEYPLFLVRNECMAHHFGEQWWDKAAQSEAVLPPLIR